MKRFSTLLIVCLGTLGNAAWADEESFNQAVSTYLRGFQDCVEANTLRTKDVAAAKAKYAAYVKLKDEAAKIDPSILQTEKRDMAKNLDYCAKTQENIAKAEASPIIEQGMAHCDNAQKALEGKDIAAARNEFKVYAEARDKAFGITDKVTDTFAIGSKVKACARVEEKIAAAEAEQKAFQDSLKDAVTLLESYAQKCSDVKAQAEKPSISVEELGSLKESYQKTQEIKKGFGAIKNSLQAVEKQPNDPLSQEIKASQAKGLECEKSVTAIISRLEGEKKKLESSIDQTTAQFQRSLENCRSARTLLDQSGTNEAQYNRARNLFADAQKQRADAEGNTSTFETTKKYPSWDATQKMKSVVTLLSTCEQGVQSAIARKDQEIAKAKVEMAEKEKQKAMAAEVAKKKAEEEAALAAKKKAEEEAAIAAKKAEADSQRARLAAEAEQRAKEEAAKAQAKKAEAEAQAAAEKEQKPRSAAKAVRSSWTDLVPDDETAAPSSDAAAGNKDDKSWTNMVPK